jgi:hypothetical protein
VEIILAEGWERRGRGNGLKRNEGTEEEEEEEEEENICTGISKY